MLKKIFITVALACVAGMMSAQITIQQPRFGDNISLGIHGGVTTPLGLNKVFPINPFGGITITKDFNPIYGVELDASAWVNDNGFTWRPSTWVTATNVGLNGTINLSNLFFGYKGKPRWFEFQTVAGLGWLHHFGDDARNNLSSTTGLRMNLNIGSDRAWTFSVMPAIWWNLSETGKVQFNKKYAQMGIQVGLTYHFKTSSGEHYFKGYDVGSYRSTIEHMNETIGSDQKRISELTQSNDDLWRANKVALREVNKLSEQLKECQEGKGAYVVLFAFKSDQLDNTAIRCLDSVPEDSDVEIYGYASPEGDAEYNLNLSLRRAEEVARYLTNRRKANVLVCEGRGAFTESSNRIVEVLIK